MIVYDLSRIIVYGLSRIIVIVQINSQQQLVAAFWQVSILHLTDLTFGDNHTLLLGGSQPAVMYSADTHYQLYYWVNFSFLSCPLLSSFPRTLTHTATPTCWPSWEYEVSEAPRRRWNVSDFSPCLQCLPLLSTLLSPVPPSSEVWS